MTPYILASLAIAVFLFSKDYKNEKRHGKYNPPTYFLSYIGFFFLIMAIWGAVVAYRGY
jgi:hypothetical protein|tara:strand:- start:1440 stop:1616 length:177 start_codon:yes stop_codon:yes gene_type:complete